MKLFSEIMILILRGYQIIVSPFFPASCRYQPTCSNYGIEAFKKHGFLKGGWLTLKRLSSCHPFGSDGYDPVP